MLVEGVCLSVGCGGCPCGDVLVVGVDGGSEDVVRWIYVVRDEWGIFCGEEFLGGLVVLQGDQSCGVGWIAASCEEGAVGVPDVLLLLSSSVMVDRSAGRLPNTSDPRLSSS